MKKVLLFISFIFCLFIINTTNVSAKEVPVYMLTKDGCPACESAIEYFDKLKNDYSDLFKLYDIEVFNSDWSFVSDDASDLFFKVYDEYKLNTEEAGTPTIIVGDYVTVGLPKDEKEVYNKIVEYNDKNKTDSVEKIANELKINLEDLLKKEEQQKTSNKEAKKGDDSLIIIGILVLIVGGLTCLVYAARRK